MDIRIQSLEPLRPYTAAATAAAAAAAAADAQLDAALPASPQARCVPSTLPVPPAELRCDGSIAAAQSGGILAGERMQATAHCRMYLSPTLNPCPLSLHASSALPPPPPPPAAAAERLSRLHSHFRGGRLCRAGAQGLS